jgi:hypothetical protein
MQIKSNCFALFKDFWLKSSKQRSNVEKACLLLTVPSAKADGKRLVTVTWSNRLPLVLTNREHVTFSIFFVY